MSIKQEVNKQITKINRITNSVYNNTDLKWKEARVKAERIVIEDLFAGRLKVVGIGEEE